ncbi:MAG: thioredoxin domain-containing protein [Candidatus Nomurabacteria bacterium]|nr:thioredoxin domain-containing protein [Candidatus Nomurabacteria bacterium]
MDKNIKIFVAVVGLLIIGIIAMVIIQSGNNVPDGKYDAFATCLKDKGAVFYGAFWCPHCQAQKKLFGSSAKLLPYVECSTPDASDQTQVCKDKKIENYPTWELADGTRIPDDSLTGAGVKLETLAAKTSCVLPK